MEETYTNLYFYSYPISRLGVGGLRCPFLQPQLAPLRGRAYPSPYAPCPWVLPLGLDGGGEVSEGPPGPQWLQEGPIEPKMASKMAQDITKWLKTTFNVRPITGQLALWPRTSPTPQGEHI